MSAPSPGWRDRSSPSFRGPGFYDAWARITAKVFRLDEVAPEVRAFVLATSKPNQEVVLGYWRELFERSPQELDAMVGQGAAAIRESGVPFTSVVGHDPSPADVAWLGANLPDARSLVWPGSGHFPHLAHPYRFAELLAETATWTGGKVAAQSRSAG